MLSVPRDARIFLDRQYLVSRLFENKAFAVMMHPHTELRFINEAIGYGVFATQRIPKGTITWILDDLDHKFAPSYIHRLEPVQRKWFQKYCYRDEKGYYILCWDIARYVNHSFQSNCVTTPYKFELAIRDIYPGEELTDDYGYFNLDQPFYCLPEEGTSRRIVLPDDLLRYYPKWDQFARDAMQEFNNVYQPLKHLIDRQYIDKVRAIAAGEMTMDSILCCYYDRSIEQNCSDPAFDVNPAMTNSY